MHAAVVALPQGAGGPPPGPEAVSYTHLDVYKRQSRGRERCQIFTDDAQMLRSHVTHSSARLAAVEAMPRRDFLQTILQRGNRFLKRFRQRFAQSISTERSLSLIHI